MRNAGRIAAAEDSRRLVGALMDMRSDKRRGRVIQVHMSYLDRPW